MMSTHQRLSVGLFAVTLGACSGEAASSMSFEQFRALVYQESQTGIFIVNGDTPIESEDGLRSFYAEMQSGVRRSSLIVNRTGTGDDRWGAGQQRSLSYCVSTGFAGNYGAVIQAMQAATAAWQQAANVRFLYRADQDAACNASNNNVLFDVSPTSKQPYLARAFFPNYARASRNILIDAQSFGSIAPYTLTGVLRHEVGHTIGFRHEHTRPEARTCFEDNSWRALTSYDSASVMHYPQCNGTNSGDLVLTQPDRDGARILYGHTITSTLAADVNGDRRADGVAVNNSDLWVTQSSGSGFGPPSRWLAGAFYGTRNTVYADVNGDGRADGVAFNEGDIWVTLSTGFGFAAPMRWLPGAFYGTRATVAADVNGDGRADGVAFNEGDIWVTLSTGSGFLAPARWLPGAFYGSY